MIDPDRQEWQDKEHRILNTDNKQPATGAAEFPPLPTPHWKNLRSECESYSAAQMYEYLRTDRANRARSVLSGPPAPALASSDSEGHRQAIADHSAEELVPASQGGKS